jgi:2,4-dienoyl-CoA reductase-like NADH-dependent reductase (Old Yellow Enzyme family)
VSAGQRTVARTDGLEGLAAAFPHLGATLAVGPVQLRNRAIVTAHTTNLGVSHEISDRHVEYHRRRAAGGFGLIITEGLRVHPTSLRRPETLSVWDDGCIAGLQRLVDAVHSEGGAIFAQLLHSGREAADDYTRIPSWGPSPLAWSRGAPMPHEMDADEIDELITCFAEATARIVAAGFDGIEVHSGHGHLLQQFLSPVTNTRTDAWGGDGPRRRALVDRVLEVVAKATPRDRVALGIRISADEFLEGGLDADTMAVLTAELVGDHHLDFVNVSHSAYVGAVTLSTQIADMSHGPAPFRHLPAGIKAAVPQVPVMMACRIDTVGQGDELIAAGFADAVAFTRASIADPDLIRVAASGGRPRRCTSCNQLCIGRTSTGLSLSCVVNPEVGLEARWDSVRDRIAAAAEARSGRPRILVIGGGPSGMEAALTAAAYADVTLVDAGTELGGTLRLAAQLRNRSGWWRLIEDLTAGCIESGVDIRLGERVESPIDGAAGPFDGVSAVVLATGAQRRPRTFGSRESVLVERLGQDRWEERITAKDRVVIHDDSGFWPGLAAVEHLIATGAEVHYVSPLAAFAPQITIYSKYGLLDRLRGADLHVHLGCRLVAWRPDGTVDVETQIGKQVATSIPDVTQVFDVGEQAASRPAIGQVPAVVIGDAYAPRDTGAAVWSGRIGGLRAVVRASVEDRSVRDTLERALTALPLVPLRTASGHDGGPGDVRDDEKGLP